MAGSSLEPAARSDADAGPPASPGDALAVLGGPAALRPIVADFVARMVADPMIGFHFRDVNVDRLVHLEAQFAARALGGDGLPYDGRPVGVAHSRHPINAGQFARRTQILRETLRDHGVDGEVVRAWLAHTERLRPAILGARVIDHGGGPCDHPGQGALVTEVGADGQVVGESSRVG